MISRHWTGVTKPGKAQDYISHLKNETFPKLLSQAARDMMVRFDEAAQHFEIAHTTT